MNALQQLLQSASNAAASNVSGPVDLIGMGLRKLGVPVPQNALMSSQWMAERGFTKPVPQNALSLAGETLGMTAPIAAAAKAPQIAVAMLQGGRNLAAPSVVNRGGASGQRGIFMGDLSKTWDADAAAKAQAMEKAGADPRAIWRETGTFKGVDGKWRQEIDDSGSMFRGFGAADSRPVGEAIHHPNAMKAYPELAEMRAQSVPGAGGSFSGEMGYAPSSPTLGLGWDNGPGTHSVALHEMQHAIQGKQGFARGGSPDEFTQQDIAEKARDLLNWQREIRTKLDKNPDMTWEAAHKATADEYASIGWPEAIPSSEIQDMARNPLKYFESPPEDFVKLYGLDKRVTPRSPREMYRSLAGEAEARAVQKRMNMNALQRRQTFPLDSYDVPLNQLIVR